MPVSWTAEDDEQVAELKDGVIVNSYYEENRQQHIKRDFDNMGKFAEAFRRSEELDSPKK